MKRNKILIVGHGMSGCGMISALLYHAAFLQNSTIQVVKSQEELDEEIRKDNENKERMMLSYRRPATFELAEVSQSTYIHELERRYSTKEVKKQNTYRANQHNFGKKR